MKFKFLTFFVLASAYLRGEPYYIKLINQCTSQFAKEVKQEDLFLAGYGGRMMDDIQQVNLSFITQKHVTIEDARKIFVDVAERYLTKVNLNEEMRPFLRNYPFMIDNLKLGISFYDDVMEYQSDLAFSTYVPERRIISYAAYNPETDCLYKIYEEPYEEAVRIVNEGK